MKRLYVWRGPIQTPHPWLVSDRPWDAPWPLDIYVRGFATHAEAIEHAQDVALREVPVAIEVTC